MKAAKGNFLEASQFMVARIKELGNPNSEFMLRLRQHERAAELHFKITAAPDQDEQFHAIYKTHLASIVSIRRISKTLDVRDLSFLGLRLLVIGSPAMIYLQCGRGAELVEMIQRMLVIHLKKPSGEVAAPATPSLLNAVATVTTVTDATAPA